MYSPMHIDLDKAIAYPKSSHNIVLNDKDSIFIPMTNNVVTITGSLAQLTIRLSKSHFYKRANYYINNFAGGFTKHNIKENTHVVYSSGKVKKAFDLGLFVLYPKVAPGSRIEVTKDIKIERQKPEPVDWTRVG